MGDTNAVDLYFAEETLWGEEPVASARAQTQIRYTGSNLERAKQSELSETIRSDRQRDGIADTGFNAQGGFNFELAYSSFDPFFKQAVTGAAYAPQTVNGITIAASNTSSNFTDSANGFGVFVVGQSIRVGGFVAATNNGVFLITSVAAGALGVTPAPGVDEAAGPTVDVHGNFTRNEDPFISQSMIIEKRFTDLTPVIFEWLNGLRVSQVSMDITAQQIVTGTFEFLGKNTNSSQATVSGGDTPSSPTEVLTGSSNVARLLVNGIVVPGGVRRVQMTINNNLRSDPQIGSKAAANVGYGFIDVTGTIEAYFEDETFLTAIEDHTDLSLFIVNTDINGNSLVFNIPRIKLMTGSANPDAVNQPVVIPAEFASIRDTVENFTINIDSLVVAP